jgi:hypothetical protein
MEAILTWDGLRWLNAALALVVVCLLTTGASIRWDTTPIRIKRMVPWIILTYSVIAYGSVEVALADGVAAPGLRVMFLTLNLSGLIVACLYGMGDPQQRFDSLNVRRTFRSDSKQRKG